MDLEWVAYEAPQLCLPGLLGVGPQLQGRLHIPLLATADVLMCSIILPYGNHGGWGGELARGHGGGASVRADDCSRSEVRAVAHGSRMARQCHALWIVSPWESLPHF